MSKGIKVIDPKNLPTKMPLIHTMVIMLMVDVWNISEGPKWLMYGFLVLAWIAFCISFVAEKHTTLKELDKE